MQGPRPVPASCGQAMHGGPALTIDWTLPLSDIKAAFEAACADAVAKATALQQQKDATASAAAAAAQQAALVSHDLPGWGFGLRSPMVPGSAAAAAAVSAVATAAAAAAARVFTKRKRGATTVTESLDEGGRDQQSSSTAAIARVAAGRAVEQRGGRRQQCSQQQRYEEGLADDYELEQHEVAAQGPPLLQPAPQAVAGRQPAGTAITREEDLEGDPPQHARKRRRRAVASAIEDTAAITAAAAAAAGGGGGTRELGVGAGSTPKAARQPAGQHMKQQTPGVLQPLSPQAGSTPGPALPAANGTAGGGGVAAQATSAGYTAAPSPLGDGSFTSEPQHVLRQFKLRSQVQQFAGYNWRLVLYFQPKAGLNDAATAADAAAADCCDADAGDLEHPGGLAPQGGGRLARRTVVAAHAVGLPDDAAAAAAGAAAAVAVGAVPVCVSCAWTARLAVEAWPCVTLQPGVSTAAFSGCLAARLRDVSTNQQGLEGAQAAAGAAGPSRPHSRARGRSRAAAAAAGVPASPAAGGEGPLRGGMPAQDMGTSPARRQIRTDGTSPARYTGPAAAAATAAAAGAGAGVRQLLGCERSPAGRRQQASAGAGALRGHSQLLSIPESACDDDDDGEEGGSEGQAGSSGEQGHCRTAEGGSDDDDEGFMVVGEYDAATGRTSGAAVTPRTTERRRQQRQAAGGRPRSAAGTGGEVEVEAVTPGGPAGAGEDDDSWRVFQLPQVGWSGCVCTAAAVADQSELRVQLCKHCLPGAT